MVSLASAAMQPVFEPGREEALWLLRLWRRSPVTLLLCDAGTDARANLFIADRVLPLTARRASDRGSAPGAADNAGLQATLRVREPADATRQTELVLRFDASRHAEPAAALRQAWWSLWPGGSQEPPGETPPPASLWKTASVLQAASGARVMLVLEGLADWMLPRNDAPAARQALLDDLSGLLEDATVHAHALLVLDHWAEPLLDRLWRRMPGLSRQLLLLDATRTPTDAVPSWIGVAPPAAASGTQLRPPLHQPGAAQPSTGPAVTPLPPLPHQQQQQLPRRGTARRLRPLAIAAGLAAVGLFVVAWAWFGRSEPSSMQAAAARRITGSVAEPAPVPVRELPGPAVADPASTLERVFSASAVPFAVALGDAAVPDALAAAARGAAVVLRYDVLETTAAQRRPGLQLLAPLFAEALQFVVRVDSPWRSLHQISASARVNVGPVDGARAATATAAGSALFGAQWRQRRLDHAPADVALQRLLQGQQVDVVLLIGDDVARAWRALSSPQRDALRLLPLDERDPSAARAQRRFLPATLAADPMRPDAARLSGLAVMNFLATGGDAEPLTMARAAQVLCAALPTLRRDAGPLWRQVRPAQTLPAPWPYAEAAVEVFEHCELLPPAPAGASSQAPQVPPTIEERKPS